MPKSWRTFFHLWWLGDKERKICSLYTPKQNNGEGGVPLELRLFFLPRQGQNVSKSSRGLRHFFTCPDRQNLPKFWRTLPQADFLRCKVPRQGDPPKNSLPNTSPQTGGLGGILQNLDFFLPRQGQNVSKSRGLRHFFTCPDKGRQNSPKSWRTLPQADDF